MKTKEQVADARKMLRDRLIAPGLNDAQKSLIIGMANALTWVAHEDNSVSLERMLANQLRVAGRRAQRPVDRTRSKTIRRGR